ncbi:hypothetical protein [Desertibaculum subflavum]|uniref:hypothetical protein n=1 Tax=Desertibaculum subflavum TaxID=2268458 RepID=UPI000E661525
MKTLGIGTTISGTSPPATPFGITVRRWRREWVRLFDPYRPELHYMRGPGPKCRAKQRLTGPGL